MNIISKITTLCLMAMLAMPARPETNLVTSDGQPVVTTEWWLESGAGISWKGIPTDILAACGGGAIVGGMVKKGLNLKAASLGPFALAGWLIYKAWVGESDPLDKIKVGAVCGVIAHKLVKKPVKDPPPKTSEPAAPPAAPAPAPCALPFPLTCDGGSGSI